MKKPLHSYFTLLAGQPSAPTFGQSRAEKLTQRMATALTERRKLVRAEAASLDPLKATYAQRSQTVERKIDRLHAEISDTKK